MAGRLFTILFILQTLLRVPVLAGGVVDGGFQVNVAGDTTLKGGAITSTQKAVDEGKNSFHTGGQLVMSDLQNQAEYNASGSQITLGVGGSLGSSSAGVGRDNGSASSTTQAGISGIAGNSSARTGDKETGIKPIFDKECYRSEFSGCQRSVKHV